MFETTSRGSRFVATLCALLLLAGCDLLGGGSDSSQGDTPAFQLPDPGTALADPVVLAVTGAEVVSARVDVNGEEWALDSDAPFEVTFDPRQFEDGQVRIEIVATLADNSEVSAFATYEVAIPTHELVVVGGTGSGTYRVGDSVQLRADPAPSGKSFDRWTGDVATVLDPTRRVTTLAMPDGDTRVEATYRDGGLPPPPAVGGYVKWGKVELELTGPESTGLDETNNPFAVEVDVTFTGPGGTFVVPAFYDGDGNGGMDGHVWKARFLPNEAGDWTWSSSSPVPQLDGLSGGFTIDPVPAGATHFAIKGPVEYVGAPYLRHANGEYWLKGGADDPEDFLANAELPTLQDKLDAIDTLALHGINSLYLMTHNIEGDGRNVWPWWGDVESDARGNDEFFNVAKLAEWETVFERMRVRGVLIHMVLEDDSGWTGFDRDLYYRNLVARFAHHPGLIWNLSEEFDENYTASQIKQFGAKLRALDPYDHPIAVHQAGSLSLFDDFLGDPNIDMTSFQTGDSAQNSAARDWYTKSKNASRRLVISFDETGKLDPSERDGARKIYWSVYLGGANFELHSWPVFEGTLTYEDYGAMFDDMTRARLFLQENTSFWNMEPRNDLLASGGDFLFALAGEEYAAYTENGDALSIDLSDATGTLSVRWFNPRTGEFTDGSDVSGGSVVSLGSPPFSGDAAVLVKKK